MNFPRLENLYGDTRLALSWPLLASPGGVPVWTVLPPLVPLLARLQQLQGQLDTPKLLS